MTTILSSAAPLGVRRSNPWVVLFLLLLIYIFNYADRFLIAGLVDPIKAEFGVGDRYIGLMMGPAFAVMYTLAGVPIARLADRMSRVAIICIGCLVWSAFTGLSGSATGPISFAICRVGVGLGEAAFAAPAYSLLAAYFGPERRGVAIAVLGLATYFGQIAGYSVGPAIADASDWRTAFHVMAIPGILLSGVAFFVIREPVREFIVTAANQIPMKRLVTELVRCRAYLLMFGATGLGTLSGISFGLWGPTLFHRAYDLPATTASNAFAMYFGLAGLTGMLLFGFLSDRIARRGMRWHLLMGGGALLAATGCILAVTWSDSFTVARWLAIPSGLLGGGWSIGMIAALQYLLPDRFRAAATALFLMAITLIGYVTGPWLTGAVSEAVGGDAAWSLRVGLSVTIPMGFIGGIMALFSARYLEANRTSLAAVQ